MDGLMTTRRPARALLDTQRVIRSSDADDSTLHLLEMTFQTEIRVTDRQHLGVHTAMRGVTNSAALVHRFVFKHVRSLLRCVTLQTRFVLRMQRGAAALVDETFVRRMAFRAGHLAFRNGMMTRQIELAADIRVACETDLFRRASDWSRDQCTLTFCRRTTGGEAVRRFDLAAGI